MNSGTVIAKYPEFSGITVEMRPILHPRFQKLKEGISEFTFANIYLFRKAHSYELSSLKTGQLIITGKDREESFFIVLLELPDCDALDKLFGKFSSLKAVTKKQASRFNGWGSEVYKDRDNFDYLSNTAELATLQGRKYHRKKNLVNVFICKYNYEGRPLLEEYKEDVLQIL